MPDPVRTCIGCRQPDEKSGLLRVVWREAGGVRADRAQTEPGRGAYLHPRAECVELAVKRKALVRALRLPGAAGDPAALRRAVEGLVDPAPQPTSRNRGPVA